MEIEQVPTDQIIEYGLNNRIHTDTQVDRIANSIIEFGFNQPIVVDEDNIVLVGHGRLMAAKKLKLKSVPVLKKSNLSEAQKKAFRILDNKLQNDSTWNFDNIKIDMEFLTEQQYDFEKYDLASLTSWLQVEREEDENTLKEKKESYDESSIKQIVLYFDTISYERVLKQMLLVQKNIEDVKDNSEVVQFLLDQYESENS